MRKVRLAQIRELEPESAKVLAAKALTPVSRDPTAKEPGWERGLWLGDRRPGQPWAKQGYYLLEQTQALHPHLHSWARLA